MRDYSRSEIETAITEWVLNERDRAVIRRRLIDGLTYESLAEEFDLSVSQVKMFGIQSSLQNCCCENRAAIADLKSTIAAEACADRAAVTAGVQNILDVICQDKIDSKNEKILELQNSLNMANLAASQVAQTAEIISKLPATTAGA